MANTEWLIALFQIAFYILLAVSLIWLMAYGGDLIAKIKRGRHRCQNCHFLIKESPQLPTKSWDEKDREDIFPRIKIPPNKLEHGGWRGDSGYDMTVGCYKKIWTEDHNELSDDHSVHRRKLRKKITLNRGESCFFVPYYEGMPMENAEELFRDKSENRRSNKRIFWLRIGVAISFLTALWSVYLHYN